ncbi:MAG: hypothetical protein ABR603_15810 [Pyrinomonadaceae bacterium]
MYLFLLKKALPFTLTLVVGTALGGLTWLFGGSGKKAEAARVTRTYDFRRGCDSRRRHRLVAESKPLGINFKPDARRPLGTETWGGGRPVVARVTFGADGKVQNVKPLASWVIVPNENLVELRATWQAVERAARQIEFTPETVDGVPVTVTRDVEIRFLPNH